MGLLRSIRLKEHDPNKDREVNVIDKYVRRSDGTIPDGPFRLRTDEHGFIQTGNTVDPNDPAVTLIGGSFVESSFSHETTRFASQAERLLPGYRVLNGGHSGATTLQLFNVMVSKLYPIIGRTGKLVFFVGQSDADALNKPGNYWNGTKLWSAIKPGTEPTATDLPEGIESTRRVVQIVIETARILEINLILAISPFRTGTLQDDICFRRIFRKNTEVFERRMNTRAAIRETTLEVAQEHGADIIDFHGLTGGNPEWFYDDLHLNEQGHTKFAKLLASELRERL